MVSQIALIAVFCVLSLTVAIPNGEVLAESARLTIPGFGVYRVLVIPALFGAALVSWILLILVAMVERVLRRWAVTPPVPAKTPPREGVAKETGGLVVEG